jgi:hypothetical protein
MIGLSSTTLVAPKARWWEESQDNAKDGRWRPSGSDHKMVNPMVEDGRIAGEV